LNSGAKAFVPNSMLNSSAAPWTPTPTANAGSSDKEKPTKKDDEAPQSSETPAPAPATASTAKKTANDNKPVKKTTAPTTSGAFTTTTANPPAFAPPVAVVNVWGKKPSNAILTAPTPDQQQQQTQLRQQNKSNKGGQNWHGNNANSNNNNGKDGDKQSQWRNNQKNDSWRGPRGGGRDGGRGGGRGRGRGRGRYNDNNEEGGGRGGQGGNSNSGGGPADNWSRGKSLPLELLKPNEGKGEMEKAVARIVAAELLSLRLSFVAPPLAWEQTSGDGDDNVVGPPDECRWESPTRLQEIDAITNAKRLGGDVSMKRKKRQESETAPPLEDCKPLEVNEDTRWKAGVFKKDGGDEATPDSNDAILKKSLLILNKLSLTKFEKLSNEFIATGIGRNEECLAGAIELIVKKAQDEPHFAAMYAALCLKLANTPMEFEPPGKKKKFKKMLLTECQKEFEQDTDTKISLITEGVDDEEERQNKINLVKKHYLGHMRFIGELYKGDLISIKVMLVCLPALLEGDVSSSDKEDACSIDEEKVECFTKLMTVIGFILEQQSLSLKKNGKTDSHEKLVACWNSIEIMAGKRKEEGPKVSNRIKFMLQDLIEMRDNGWIQRREEESAKTIAQIHKEAAKEARRGSSSGGMNKSMSSSNIRRQSSSNDVLSIARSSSKPNVDSEGFTEIGRTGGFGRSQSLGNFTRTDSKTNLKKAEKTRVASGGSFAAFNDVGSGSKKDSQKTKSKDVLPDVDEKKASSVAKVYKSPEECGKKTKNYLKEYFVGGDTDDVVLSLHELIGAGSDGSIDRGATVVNNGVLMVLEMKADNVDKFISVITRCFAEEKIEAQAIVNGLNDPLEFLSDIAIDAPLATSHMVSIVSKMIEVGAVKFDFLLDSPEYFRTDCGAAQFGCKVLKKLGGDAVESKANLDIIEKLMTDGDKELYPSGAKDMLC